LSDLLHTTSGLIGEGSGSFAYEDPRSQSNRRPLAVHYHHPAKLRFPVPVVFVMHGQRRNGSSYRNRWICHAEQHGFLLLVPEFDPKMYPDVTHYNLAHMVPQVTGATFHPEEEWAFHQIEGIFASVRSSFSSLAPTYSIYGHSAGAQFVHRLVLFHPSASFHLAIAANAGWYTLPCQNTGFPYGVGDTPLSESHLAQALQRRLLVLLGESDTDQNHPLLRRNAEALQQGRNRLERGITFFQRGQLAAQRLEVEFRWELDIVKRARHLDRAMSQAATHHLLSAFSGPDPV
jgi:hypothetical protein